jgi:damage-control phosphatase, subfamily I
MERFQECIRCIERQIESAAALATSNPSIRKSVVEGALEVLKSCDATKPPPYTGERVHRAIRAISGNTDPYKLVKQKYNELALSRIDEFRNIVAESRDPFRTAVLMAIAGNRIDLAIGESFDLEDTIGHVIKAPLGIDRVEDLRARLSRTQKLLFIADNAGETVFDRVLIEQLPSGIEVSYAVRGGPILNDALIEDALFAGLDTVATVISTGSNAPGAILEECNKGFVDIFEQADLVISKGMGNFESLTGRTKRDVFYLLLVKCDLVARHLNCPKGSAAVLRELAFEQHNVSSVSQDDSETRSRQGRDRWRPGRRGYGGR